MVKTFKQFVEATDTAETDKPTGPQTTEKPMTPAQKNQLRQKRITALTQKQAELRKQITAIGKQISDLRAGKNTDTETVTEMFGDPEYHVKRVNVDEFEVAKFTDKNEPEAVYKVYQRRGNEFTTNSPAFHRLGQQEKHIKLVKRFLKEGEPELMTYKFGDDGTISSRKLV